MVMNNPSETPEAGVQIVNRGAAFFSGVVFISAFLKIITQSQHTSILKGPCVETSQHLRHIVCWSNPTKPFGLCSDLILYSRSLCLLPCYIPANSQGEHWTILRDTLSRVVVWKWRLNRALLYHREKKCVFFMPPPPESWTRLFN